MDINTVIHKAIEQQVHAVVNEAIEDMQMRFEGLRGNIANRMNDIEAAGRLRSARHEELFNRVNELAADIGRWKGQQLALPEQRFKEIFDQLEALEHGSPTHAAFVALRKEVDRLRRHVEALDHAKAKDDESFQADVKTAVADVLNEGLAQAVADAFQNGELTISVDKV